MRNSSESFGRRNEQSGKDQARKDRAGKDQAGKDQAGGDRTGRNGLTAGGERVNPDHGDGRGRDAAGELARIPAGVRACVVPTPGVYDARRLRSQREIIRDVMLSAAECETWLTLGELRALTRYGEASISAQLRHLRKAENGGYDVEKRHREGAAPERPGTDGRGECVWEYRMTRDACEREAAGDRSGGLGAAA